MQKVTFVTRARSNQWTFWLNLLSTVGVNDLLGIFIYHSQKVHLAALTVIRGSRVRVLLCNVEKCRMAMLNSREWVICLVIGTWMASSHLKENNAIHSRGQCTCSEKYKYWASQRKIPKHWIVRTRIQVQIMSHSYAMEIKQWLGFILSWCIVNWSAAYPLVDVCDVN